MTHLLSLRHSCFRQAFTWPATAVLVVLLVLPKVSWSWGAEAHRMVAEMAERHLSKPAQLEMERLLALEPEATLSSISTWADENRSPSTAGWHYVNLPRDGACRYEAARSCIQGACVVAALERQVAVLASHGSDEVRLKALKYVVHLVADIHQPLHAGFAEDRGGNGYQLQAFGRGTNLHALWDSGLVRAWPGGLPSLESAVLAVKAIPGLRLDPASWAEESCRVVATESFYPPSRQLDPEYPTRWSATLALQLSNAGYRLAAVLNESLPRKITGN